MDLPASEKPSMDSPRLERSSMDDDTLVDPDAYATEDIELLAMEKPRRLPASRWHRLLGSRESSSSLHQKHSSRGFSFTKPVAFGSHHLLAFIAFLLPSFITSFLSRIFFAKSKANATHKKPLHETAYLDGLRGVAAFIVYIFHWSYLWFPFLRKGFGSSPTSEDLFIQRPVIRFIHSGRASVTLFFVISGYVITLKTLSTIHAGQPGTALEVLSGSLFRRPLRLYLPIIVQTLIILVLVRWNMIDGDISGARPPPRADNLHDQLQHWWVHFCKMVNPFRVIAGRTNLYGNPYDGHLWTIPTEFKGSLLVFLFLLAFARTRRWLHLLVVIGSISWLAQLGELDMALFCAGMVLAELSLVLPPGGRQKEASLTEIQQPHGKGPRAARLVIVIRHVMTLAFFVVALHLMSYPETGGPSSPGFRTISKWVPEFYAGREEPIQWFWISTGSVLFILALMYSPALPSPTVSLARLFRCCRCSVRRKTQQKHEYATEQEAGTQGETQNSARAEPLLQRAFTHPFSQYLGHISYALYLAHGTVNHTIGTQYLNPAFAAWQVAEQNAAITSKDGSKASVTAMLASAWNAYMWKAVWGTTVNTFVLFWVSDVFWRAVDVKAVKLTRWLAEKARRL